MNRTIGFDEYEFNSTISKIDGIIRHMMEHHLPLIYEKLSEQNPKDAELSRKFATDIFVDMIKTFAEINQSLEQLDHKPRHNVSLNKVKEQITKFIEMRKRDDLY